MRSPIIFALNLSYIYITNTQRSPLHGRKTTTKSERKKLREKSTTPIQRPQRQLGVFFVLPLPLSLSASSLSMTVYHFHLYFSLANFLVAIAPSLRRTAAHITPMRRHTHIKAAKYTISGSHLIRGARANIANTENSNKKTRGE